MPAVFDVTLDHLVVGGVAFMAKGREFRDGGEEEADNHDADHYAYAGVEGGEEVEAVNFEPAVVAFLEGGLVEAGVLVLRLVGEGQGWRRVFGDDFVFWAGAVSHYPVEE